MYAAIWVQGEDPLEAFRGALAARDNVLLRAPGLGNGRRDLLEATAAGLRRRPRRLECRFLYDARGSELFERICQQPEYYLTRTEAGILAGGAGRIARLTGPVTLAELGSGYSVKTDHLLAAYQQGAPWVRYVAVDVSVSALWQAGRLIAARRSNVQVLGIHGVYQAAFPLLQAASPIMVVFLGSTVGNLDEAEAARFWATLSAHLRPGDFVLLGVDLVKEPARLQAAYNDAAGVTAAFTKNLLVRLNRELGCAVDPAAAEHVARYSPERQRIETHLRFTRRQVIELPELGERFELRPGEEVLVEISRKFRLEALQPELRAVGLETAEVLTDRHGWYALLLLRKVAS
jgi:L-histidine N-alpha-methyltransferase